MISTIGVMAFVPDNLYNPVMELVRRVKHSRWRRQQVNLHRELEMMRLGGEVDDAILSTRAAAMAKPAVRHHLQLRLKKSAKSRKAINLNRVHPASAEKVEMLKTVVTAVDTDGDGGYFSCSSLDSHEENGAHFDVKRSSQVDDGGGCRGDVNYSTNECISRNIVPPGWV